MNYEVKVLDIQFQGKALAIYAFLIETSAGPILIETGPHSSLPSLESELAKHGYKKEDIKHVFLTHIHLDHGGAAWCFAEHGAKIYLHPFGFRHFHDPTKLLASATMIYGDMMDQLWGTLKPIPEDQLIICEDGEEIQLDDQTVLKSIHSPGHAKHHIAWQMDETLFTGDVAGVCINNGPIVPPCPPPDINIEVWHDSIDKILNIDAVKRYYLTHGGLITDIHNHMNRLKEILNDYAAFIKPYFDNQVSQEEIRAPFEKFVLENLTEQGMKPELAEAYNLANPAYMSIAGLMRYWYKKQS